MKKIILFIILIITSSCSTIPQSPFDLLTSKKTNMSVEEMDRAYPFWKVKLFDFWVANTDAGIYKPSFIPTPEENRNARILNIRSKEIMLEKLNVIRFVVNTPEFADDLQKHVFRSSRDGTGSFGSIKQGDIMDNNRLIKVIQKASFYSSINKRQVSYLAAATANVGNFLYLANDQELNDVSFKGLFVNFPNKWSWESYATNDWITEALFHELLHNMGFNHKVPNDATYGIQAVFARTYADPKWKKKYKKQLDLFQYYNKKYKHFLQADTVPIKTKHNAPLSIDQIKLGITYTIDPNKIEEVCILYEDGTHKLVKMRNGRII